MKTSENSELHIEPRVWTCINNVTHGINLKCDCTLYSNSTSPVLEYSKIIYWSCGNCSYDYNLFDNPLCVTCGLNRQHTWTCTYCLCNSNNGRMSACGECFEKRRHSMVYDSPESAIYSCGDCGAVSAVNRDKCYKCNEPC